MSVTRSQVVAAARQYIGIRYAHQGFIPPPAFPEGLDCRGLIHRTGLDIGALPEGLKVPGYTANSLPRHDSLLNENLDRIEIEELKPGDIAILCHRPEKSTRWAHMAIVTELGLIQIVAQTIPRIAEHSMDAYLQSRIVAAYRYRNVED